jgi:hypothetical protein
VAPASKVRQWEGSARRVPGLARAGRLSGFAARCPAYGGTACFQRCDQSWIVASVVSRRAGHGAVILFLYLVGYLTQRRDRGRGISELKKDLEIHKPRATAATGKLADGQGMGFGW